MSDDIGSGRVIENEMNDESETSEKEKKHRKLKRIFVVYHILIAINHLNSQRRFLLASWGSAGPFEIF